MITKGNLIISEQLKESIDSKPETAEKNDTIAQPQLPEKPQVEQPTSKFAPKTYAILERKNYGILDKVF